jgi:hypothetical protein
MSEFTEKISETTRKLKLDSENDPEHLNFIALRELQIFCDKYTFETSDPVERIVSYLITKCLDDIFTNFNVDTTYNQELLNARIEIFEVLQASLPKIERCLYNKELKFLFDTFSIIVETYTVKINYLNRIL